ncbi:hypothetical protein PLICRDRAFT_48886 [Plicaturopsis crispa FD-325 SS-3]|nr:hypothetical protein PLICRDRAFT_48886 [Plicaturopsis crispa FD-325 SS-3]
MDLGLNDTSVLITGASGGIGLETARWFLENGARVVLHYNTNSTSIVPLLDQYGPERAVGVKADLASEKDVQRIFSREEIPLFWPVQVLVVNHGSHAPAAITLADMSLDQWRSATDANLTSAFLVLREFLRGIPFLSDKAKENANVVLIGSTAGKYGEEGHADYAACKSAMMYGLLLSAKNEIVRIAPHGRANCVAPGWVHTPLAAERLKNPAILGKAVATIPMRKVAKPADVAAQVVLLASARVSGHVSGQVVMVAGGMEGRVLHPDALAQ